MLADGDSLYNAPTFHEYGDDLGTLGDTTWVPPTRAYLNAHSECNVVMWSWCGGCTGNTEEGIDIYLNAMSGLEANYPNVTFIYMTGHLDGTGVGGSLYRSNNQIRDYCDESMCCSISPISRAMILTVPTILMTPTHAVGVIPGAPTTPASTAVAAPIRTASTVIARGRRSGR
jgi:hypothetical protein